MSKTLAILLTSAALLGPGIAHATSTLPEVTPLAQCLKPLLIADYNAVKTHQLTFFQAARLLVTQYNACKRSLAEFGT